MMKMNNKRHGRAVIVIMAMMMVSWPLNSNSQVPSIKIRPIIEALFHRPIPPVPPMPLSIINSTFTPSIFNLPISSLTLPKYNPYISEATITSFNPYIYNNNDFQSYNYDTDQIVKLINYNSEYFKQQLGINKSFGRIYFPGVPLNLDSLNHYKYPYNSTFFPVQGIQGIHRNDTILCDSLLAVSHELGTYLKTKSYSEEQLKYLSNVKSNIDLAVTSVNPLVGLNLLSYYIEIADTVFQNEKPEEITQLFQRLNVIVNESGYKKALEIMPLKERLKATTNSSSPRQ